MRFIDKLSRMMEKNNTLLCVGLDTDVKKIPQHLFKEKDPLFTFNRNIVDATADLVCCYKLNMAFYETLGQKGVELLTKTMEYIPGEIPVILDGKKGDIGNTARQYAYEVFELYKADAATVNPYMGLDSIQPFIDYEDKCTFILCRTSNPSAGDLQNLPVGEKKTPLYQIVARKIKDWNKKGNCGVVAGATYPEDLKTVRSIVGDNIPLLIPGVGKQGGDLEKSVKYGVNSEGKNAIINSSRGVLYAGKGEDFALLSRKTAEALRDEINRYR
ncbi:MAG TPA: orotidine-5'-phosphate decarboxylase [Thermoplasmatales archaeon]|nr:orotidine-5'-phosphate decarboxylase [Thermoplasmatales archaeon]